MADALASAEPGRDEWRRTVPGWHLAFATLAVLTAGLCATQGGTDAGERYPALATLALLCVWYAAVGVRALHGQSPRLGLVYVAGSLVLTLWLFVLMPVGSLMLFMLYPHLWALLSVRRAVTGTAIGITATAAVLFGRAGSVPGRLADVLVPSVVALVVALVLGLWISRIIEQSSQRASLIAELAAARAQLATVSHQAGVLAERERLAREIHDTLAQGFTSVLLLLEAMEAEIGSDDAGALSHLDRARGTARESLVEARAFIAELSPPQLRDASLPDALRQLVGRVGSDLCIDPVLTVTGVPRPLPAAEEVVLLRAAQELLTNVRKHTAATRVEVELAYADDRVMLRIADDGPGFDPAATLS